MSSLQTQPTLKEERQPSYLPTTNLHRQTEPPASTNSNQTESVQPLVHNSYNLHDATQVEALLANLRQVMSQIEKLQAS
ncbi:MAG: hypothetical protein HC772_08695 [Leptolyngbyaceae cyanobacterium CRU_2_3]|nr:hypothetical protein [Leptolyngbyaceae cyanobacterium CRU_2_3]